VEQLVVSLVTSLYKTSLPVFTVPAVVGSETAEAEAVIPDEFPPKFQCIALKVYTVTDQMAA